MLLCESTAVPITGSFNGHIKKVSFQHDTAEINHSSGILPKLTTESALHVFFAEKSCRLSRNIFAALYLAAVQSTAAKVKSAILLSGAKGALLFELMEDNKPLCHAL